MLKYVVLILRHNVSKIKNLINIRLKEYNKVFARKASIELSDRCFVTDSKKSLLTKTQKTRIWDKSPPKSIS